MKIFIPPKDILSLLTNDEFDLRKDFKKLDVDQKIIETLISDQLIRPPEGLIVGATLVGDSNTESIVKHDLNYNNVGKRRGFRLISIVDKKDGNLIVLHIFNKSDKKDLTKSEKKTLSIILADYKEFKPYIVRKKEE